MEDEELGCKQVSETGRISGAAVISSERDVRPGCENRQIAMNDFFRQAQFKQQLSQLLFPTIPNCFYVARKTEDLEVRRTHKSQRKQQTCRLHATAIPLLNCHNSVTGTLPKSQL
jgi:hypothetical protein